MTQAIRISGLLSVLCLSGLVRADGTDSTTLLVPQGRTQGPVQDLHATSSQQDHQKAPQQKAAKLGGQASQPAEARKEMEVMHKELRELRNELQDLRHEVRELRQERIAERRRQQQAADRR